MQDGRAGKPLALKDGDAFVRRGGAAATLARRPPADLLAGLPRAFVDSLPRRAARFQDRPVEPGAGVAGRLRRGRALAERRGPRCARLRRRALHAAGPRPRASAPRWWPSCVRIPNGTACCSPRSTGPSRVTVARRDAPAASQPHRPDTAAWR